MSSVQRTTSALAITSLVSGILGWTFLPLLGSIVAIITGHMARAEIRREPERLQGDGLAIGGLVMGYGIIALAIIAVVVVVLFFGGIAWLGTRS